VVWAVSGNVNGFLIPEVGVLKAGTLFPWNRQTFKATKKSTQRKGKSLPAFHPRFKGKHWGTTSQTKQTPNARATPNTFTVLKTARIPGKHFFQQPRNNFLQLRTNFPYRPATGGLARGNTYRHYPLTTPTTANTSITSDGPQRSTRRQATKQTFYSFSTGPGVPKLERSLGDQHTHFWIEPHLGTLPF